MSVLRRARPSRNETAATMIAELVYEIAYRGLRPPEKHEATRVHCTGQQRGTFHAALLFSFRKCANCRFQSSRPTPRASRPRAERASKKPAETAAFFVPLWRVLSRPPGPTVHPLPTPLPPPPPPL